MRRVKPVSAVQNGVTVRKIAYRDMSLFPDTDAGDAALLLGIQNGTVPLYPRPSDSRILASVPAHVTETRTDSTGKLYVSSKVPIFTKNVLPFPPGSGISVKIPEQTAQGLANFDRFINHAGQGMRDKKLIVFGPWHPAVADNKHFDHLVDGVNCWPNFRLPGAVSSTNNLDPARKFFMYSDAEVRATAAGLLSANPNSPFVSAWNSMANAHDYTSNPGAFQAIGVKMWQDARIIFDSQGRGLKYISLDLETTDDYQLNRECLGNIYAGYCGQAALDGFSVEPNLYGQSSFRVDVYNTSLKQFVTGLPEYLRDYMDLFPSPAADATIKACNDYHGAVTDDGYFQRLWPEDLNLLLRNPDNTLQLAGGLPQYNTSPTQGTVYGQTIPLEASEAPHFMSDFMRNFARKFVQRYWFANGYPSTESLRRAGMENTKFGTYLRVSSEAVAGMIYNDRPMPYWLLKLIQFYNLFESDISVAWGDDWNQTPLAPGQASPKWSYAAGGTLEAILHAAEEYAYYDDYHVGEVKRAWFNLDIVSSNNIDGEFVYQKIVLKVKIRTVGGKQYIEVFACQPLLDNTSMTVKLFWKKNGKTSKAYTIVLLNGRSFHYSMFQVPDDTEFLNLSGDDLVARFTDLLGVVRTWPGNYNLMTTFDATIATPPDYDTGELVVVTPGGGGGTALTFGTATYDGPNNKLKIPVVGLVGTPTYIIVGYGIFTAQPAEGFTLPGNCINTLVTFRVHTDTQAEISGSLDCNSASSATPSNGFPSAYQWDVNTKGYTAYALVPDQSTSTVQLTPQDGQTGPGAAVNMLTESNTVLGVTYNRRYTFLPAFAGGPVDILAGHWKQTVLNNGVKAEGIALLVDNTPGVITTGSTANGGGGGTTTPPVNSTGFFNTHFAVGPNIYVNDEGDPALVADRFRVIDTCQANGCNLVRIGIIFSSMQSMASWSHVSDIGAEAKRLGMKIGLCLDLSPTIDWIGHAARPGIIPAVPGNLVRQTNQNGQPFIGAGNTASFSLYDQNALNFYGATAGLWTDWVNTQDWASEVVSVELSFGATRELQYDFNTYVGQTAVPNLASYDASALAAFRVQMAGKFGSIATMNQACGTSFATFNDLTFPVPATSNLATAFQGVYGSYFMQHRMYGIKQFIAATYGVVAGKSPNWTQIFDTGSLHDGIAGLRGTTNSVYLTAGSAIQVVKVNSQLGFDFEHDTDACSAGGMLSANELDYAQDSGSDGQAVAGKYDQLVRCAERGAAFISLNCYGLSNAKLIELLTYHDTVNGVNRLPVAGLIARGRKGVPRTVVQTIAFSTSTHMIDGNDAFSLQAAWQSLYDANNKAGIDIQYTTPTFP